jgi:hypothetical protein
MRNTRKSGRLLRSKNSSRLTLKEWEGKPDKLQYFAPNPGEADSAVGAGPEIGLTDPTGRSSGSDHGLFSGLARGDRNITFAVCQL